MVLCVARAEIIGAHLAVMEAPESHFGFGHRLCESVFRNWQSFTVHQ